MLELIKRSCGIAESITVYDEDILVYIKNCMGDMVSSGVPKHIAESRRTGRRINRHYIICQGIPWK